MNAVAAIGAAVVGNAEAEAALCGALMQAPRSIDYAADRLTPEDFSDPVFGNIFAAILKEHGQGRAPTPITVAPYFADDRNMASLGGALPFLATLTGSGALVLALKDSVEVIRSLAQRRRLLEGLQDAVELGMEYETGVDEIAAAAETALAEVQEESSGTGELTASQCIDQALNYDGYGITSGILPIDSTLGPVMLKDLTIVAGRPGMCKTATALSYAIGAAQRGHGVLFISIEMSGLQLGARMAADWCFDRGDTQVPFEAITASHLTQEQGRAVARASDSIGDLPIVIEDVSSITPAQLDRKVRRHARRFAANGKKLELVIVDYLQKMQASSKANGRVEAITEISMGLKTTAKANNVGVMALAQLSRAVEQRADKRPQLSDLRESGQIEQDADAVLFLFRPEYYLDQEEPPIDDQRRPKWEQMKDEVRGRLEFICGKRRQGRTGIGYGTFYGAFQAVRG